MLLPGVIVKASSLTPRAPLNSIKVLLQENLKLRNILSRTMSMDEYAYSRSFKLRRSALKLTCNYVLVSECDSDVLRINYTALCL